MSAEAALDQDPEWRFNATPPPWMIGLVMAGCLAAVLLSELVVAVLVRWVTVGGPTQPLLIATAVQWWRITQPTNGGLQ